MCGIEGGCAAPSGLAKKIGGNSLTQGVALVPPRRDGAPPWGCDCCHRLRLRTAIKKYRSERKGRRAFDTALEYSTVGRMAAEKTRNRKTDGPRYLFLSPKGAN